jgi:Leucine-rich repeat (LRR) protein
MWSLGIIPTNLGSVQTLTVLNMSSADFTGTLPKTLATLRSLILLYINDNWLTGPIPSDFGVAQFGTLLYFSLSGNSLTGTISDALIAIPAMRIFDIDSNVFTGPVPFRKGLSASIEVYEISSNYFTGTLTSNWTEFARLEYCYMDSNYLSGTLPSAIIVSIEPIGDTALVQFGAAQNMLEGTLSADFWLHKNLQGLAVNDNNLYGTIPTEIISAESLTNLDLANNHFSGNLGMVFTAPLRNLTYINLANNSFEGQIPDTLFDSAQLQVVVMNSNCFSGTIPENMCSAIGLQTIIMDSLSSGCAADLGFLRRIIKGLFPRNILEGSIPQCLFQLQNLSTLQLSGNGLRGSIPNVDPVAGLKNLQLALNALTGTIPRYLQESGQFSYLYLQNNKLSGTLISDFAVLPSGSAANGTVTMDLSLDVNRLSGFIPQSFIEMPTLSVVTGNLFQCDASSLPLHDAGSRTYSCGSQQLDNALYVWLSIMLAIFATCALFLVVLCKCRSAGGSDNTENARFSLSVLSLEKVRAAMFGRESDPESLGAESESRRQSKSESTTPRSSLHTGLPQSVELSESVAKIYEDSKAWVSVDLSIKRKPLTNTIQYCLILKHAGRGTMFIALSYIICLVSYLIIKSGSAASTTTFQYGWNMTSAYLHGYAPAILIFLYVLITLLVCLSTIGADFISSAWNIRSIQREEWKSALRYNGKFGAMATRIFDVIVRPGAVHIVNFVVVLIVNVIYVDVLLKIPSQYVFFVEAALSAFKIIWVNGYIPVAMRQMRYMSSQAQFRHQVFMMLVVYIVGPGIASVGANSNCFYDAVVGSEAVSSSFVALNSGYACSVIFDAFHPRTAYDIDSSYIACSLYATSVTSETVPPFVYSYQCGSSFLVDYIPVLFYTYLYAAVLLPVGRFCMLHTSNRTMRQLLGPWLYQRLIHRTVFDYEGCIADFKLLTAPLSIIATPSMGDVQLADVTRNPVVDHAESSNFPPVSESNSRNTTPRNSTFQSVSRRHDIVETALFDGTTVVAKRIVDFCVILTFGLACPLLAITVAISVYTNSAAWRLMIGKFVFNVGKDNFVAFARLEQSYCDGLLRGSMGGLWLTIPVISLFWSLMFYDMVGDLYGNITGWIFVTVAFIANPAILYGVYRFRKHNAILAATGPRKGPSQQVVAGRLNSRALSDDQRSRSDNNSGDLWIQSKTSVLPVIPSTESNSNF